MIVLVGILHLANSQQKFINYCTYIAYFKKGNVYVRTV